jgi:hypothetical protein
MENLPEGSLEQKAEKVIIGVCPMSACGARGKFYLKGETTNSEGKKVPLYECPNCRRTFAEFSLRK